MPTGFKTYIVVAIAIVSAILGYFSDQMTLLQALEGIGLALGVGGNRAVLKVGEVLNAPFNSTVSGDPRTRQWVTYIGSALTVLTAILAGVNGEQPSALTIAAILGALGLNFLGLGATKVATGEAAVIR